MPELPGQSDSMPHADGLVGDQIDFAGATTRLYGHIPRAVVR